MPSSLKVGIQSYSDLTHSGEDLKEFFLDVIKA